MHTHVVVDRMHRDKSAAARRAFLVWTVTSANIFWTGLLCYRPIFLRFMYKCINPLMHKVAKMVT